MKLDSNVVSKEYDFRRVKIVLIWPRQRFCFRLYLNNNAVTRQFSGEVASFCGVGVTGKELPVV